MVGIKRELKRGEASLNILPPLLLKERGIKGVRLINNLKLRLLIRGSGYIYSLDIKLDF